MAVKILSRQYTNQFRPNDTNVDWLLGNTGVWQKLTLQCLFSVDIEFTTSNPLIVDEPNKLTLSSGTWADYGFANGDRVFINYTYRDLTQSPFVDFVNFIPQNPLVPVALANINGADAELVVEFTGAPLTSTGVPVQIIPTTSANYQILDVRIFTVKRPQSVELTYGHLTNNDVLSNNIASFIDGTLTSFVSENADTLTTNQTVAMDAVGDQSGMSIAKVLLTYRGAQDVGHVYDIDIIFMVSSFFDDITTFETNTSPDVTLSSSCLTDNFSIVGYPEFNNPNVKIQNEMDDTQQEGNTGWFDENYNGLDNDFTVSSVTYKQNNVIIQNLDYSKNTDVEIVIDGVQNISGQTKCGFGFSWIPIDDDVYKVNEYPFYKNVKMNTGGDAENLNDYFVVSPASSGLLQGYSKDNSRMDVEFVKFEQTGTNQITFSATFKPTSDFATQFGALDSTQRKYIIWLSVADQSLSPFNYSNRVSLLADFNTMEKYIAPIGEYPGMDIVFIDHPYDETHTPTCGINMMVEDDVLMRALFRVDTATGSTIPIPTGITYAIGVEKNSDASTYLLDRYSIDLSQYPDPTQYNFTSSRGFKLGPNNNKNQIACVYHAPLNTGTEKGVRGLYGFKVRWEDWIKRLNVPQSIVDDFYDNTEKNNGINNDWYQWYDNNDYSFNFYVYLDAILDGQEVRYVNKRRMYFFDYNNNSNITTTVSTIRESDGTVLSGGTDPISGLPLGVLIEDEVIRLRILYTLSTGTWSSIVNKYALNCIEVDEGAGQFEFRQLSSIFASEFDNPLFGIPGSTLADISLVSPTQLQVDCLLTVNKLIDSERYKISGRIGCK